MPSSPVDRALRTFVPVDDGESGAALWSFAYFFFLLGGYYMLRPVREAMGVAGGVDNLPWMFTAVFLVLLAAVPAFGALVARLPRRRFVPAVYRFFLLNILVFAALLHFDVARRTVAQGFFVWVTVYNMFVVSVFWSVMADVFSSQQGKRLFGFIAAGGSTGALFGSWITSILVEPAGLAVLLVLSATLLECAVQCFGRVTRPMARPLLMRVDAGGGVHDRDRTSRPAVRSPGLPEQSGQGAAGPPGRAERPIGGSIIAGATQVARSPYLAGICLYLLCMSLAATFVYIARAQIVAEAFSTDEVRSAFFAVVDAMNSLLTLLLQLLLTARVLRWLGIALTLAVLPLLTVAGFIGLSMLPVLSMLVVFQVAMRAARHSITRPGREMLFTVVSREQKYKCKNFIDTVVYRGGDALSSWAFRTLQALGLGLASIAVAAVPITLVWLAAAVFLGRRQEARARNSG